MKDREDFRYIVLGGSAMAFLSAYLNVGAIILWGWSVGHMTGTAAKTGITLAYGSHFEFAIGLGIIASFIIGAILSAILVGNTKFNLGARYGIAIFVVAILVYAGFILEHYPSPIDWVLGVFTFALASGFQNAMCTTFSGAVIRTTHITGTCTDIGAVIGLWIRYRNSKPDRVELWKLKVLVPLLVSYIVGSMTGALFVKAAKHWYLLLPATGLAVLGGIYTLVRYFADRRNKKPTAVIPEKTSVEMQRQSPVPSHARHASSDSNYNNENESNGGNENNENNESKMSLLNEGKIGTEGSVIGNGSSPGVGSQP